MKSITVTTNRSINFGAALQAYALQRFITQIGIENRLLDTPAVRTMCNKPKEFFSKNFLITMVSNIVYLLNVKTTKRMLNRFDEFAEHHTIRTKQYKGYKDINSNPPQADFYITGSDQVFSVRSSKKQIRMLNFGDKNVPRFSYAASLGEYDWSDSEKKLFRQYIRNFNCVSVREKDAKEYLEPIIERDCFVHLDPVFLLDSDEWSAIESTLNFREPYILCYPLISNVKMQDTIDLLKEKTGLKVICVQTLPLKRIKADKYIFDAGPIEFLGLIKNAEYVVTTSFHGTALAIVFHKKFYTLVKNYRPQRITNLLSLLQLNNRLVDDECKITTDEIDFSYCDKIIQTEKKSSIAYFDNIVSIVKNNKESLYDD